MDIRRGVAGLGRAFIATGTLILLFVAYQLWGTNLAEARAQDALFDDFREQLAAVDDRSPPSTARGSSEPPASTTTTVPPRPVPGDAVAIIAIPKIGVEKAVVEGVGVSDLKKGPGHYPGTPMPGQPGNAAIAGHRTTYGAPFHDLDELEPGDPIEVTTRQGRFTYEVTESLIVRPTQREVLDPTDDNRLTLTTCHPRFSARQRLIVVAQLVEEPAPAPPPPPAPAEPADPGDGDEPADEPAGDDPLPGEEVPAEAPTEVAGLSGDPAARTPTLLWGLATAAVGLATWVLSRRWGKLPAYLLGTPVFLLVLFVFFENVSRLLPANV